MEIKHRLFEIQGILNRLSINQIFSIVKLINSDLITKEYKTGFHNMNVGEIKFTEPFIRIKRIL